MELVNYRKDGSEFWTDMTIVPVADRTGRHSHWVSIRRETTNRKQAELRLRESEARKKAILDAALDCVIAIDHQGKIIEFNPAAERTFGYRREETINHHLAELIIPASLRAEHRRGMSQYLATGEGPILGRRFETTALRADGAEFPVELTITAVRGQGPPFFTAYLRDMTDKKRVESELVQAKEAAEAANQAKSVFLSRMSQELRTPLNSILGFSQLLEMEELNADQRENVQYIRKAGLHLFNLINEVLDIGRVEAGTLTTSIEAVEMDQVLAEVFALIRPSAVQAKVELRLLQEKRRGASVLADLQRLKQVLLNLLSNAVKYNRPGGSVEISCRPLPGGKLRVRVTDTGPGIAAEDIPRLFVPFQRLGAEKRGVEGVGLGLVISRRLMEAMHGALGVESEFGRGSTFWLELPLAHRPREGSARSAEAGAATPAKDVIRGTVLYIEDNLAVVGLMGRILERRPGVRLLSAMQGRVGLDLARQHLPDLIVLDFHLADVRGDEMLQWLRDDERLRGIPVAFLSGGATPHDQERALAAGARYFLTKPIDVSEFLQIVDEALAAKER